MIPIEDLLRFIREDAPWGDVTSETVVPDVTCRAVVRAKSQGIVAGLSEARRLFEHFGVTVRERSADGRAVAPGTVLLDLDGPARAILLVERTALNIIGRMSGIATRTREAVEAVRAVSPDVRVAATRKTAPGLRALDKKAVILGGGDPHRYTLSDMVLGLAGRPGRRDQKDGSGPPGARQESGDPRRGRPAPLHALGYGPDQG